MSTSQQSDHSSGDSSGIAACVTIPVVLVLVAVLLWNCRRTARARRREEEERLRRASTSARLQAALAVLRMQAPPPTLRTRYRDGTSDSSAPRESREPAVAMEEQLLVCTYLRADGWQEATCPVCLSEMEDGETVRVLPVCMHYFHDACVGDWLRENSTCPLCRGPPAAAADPAAAV
ncbi:unnamed protein product [Alopecurus aequalis]